MYNKDGDIFYTEIKTGKTKKVTETLDAETNPQFSFGDSKIVYTRSQNLFAWTILTGETSSLLILRAGATTPATHSCCNTQQQPRAAPINRKHGLKKINYNILKCCDPGKRKKIKADAYTKDTKKKELRSIALEDKILQGLSISPDGRFISYRLNKPVTSNKTTIVPNYVTESGFTTDIPARTKVGEITVSSEFFIYDREKDTVLAIKADSIPGINDLPDYVKDYPKQLEERNKKLTPRQVSFYWSLLVTGWRTCSGRNPFRRQ